MAKIEVTIDDDVLEAISDTDGLARLLESDLQPLAAE